MPDQNQDPNNSNTTSNTQGFTPVVEEVGRASTPPTSNTQFAPQNQPANMGIPPAPSYGPQPAQMGPAQVNFGDNTFAANSGQVASNIPPVVTTPTSTPQQSRKGIVPTIIGILFLVAAVGAGIVLVQQQQNINEKASTAAMFCGAVSDPDNNLINTAQCQDQNVCWKATVTNECLVNGQPQGALEYFTGMDAWDGTVCYDCVNEPGSTVDNPGTICSTGTKVGGNDALCPSSGGGATTAPTEPPYTNGVCGDQCQTDSQCQGSSNYNVRVGCRNNKCVNLDCEEGGGETIPGQLCACRGIAHSCGESCGAGIGLCDSSLGVSCQYLAQSQCSPGTRWPICAPSGSNASDATGPLTGVAQYNGASFESRKCGPGTGDPGNNYLWHPEFTSGFTQQQVADLICAGTPAGAEGQCLSVHIYDTSWNELTSAELAALTPGSTIRVTVMGSATSGTITQARFTFNGTLRSPVTQKKPGTNEFYDEVTIPTSATTVTVRGEIYHPDLGWF